MDQLAHRANERRIASINEPANHLLRNISRYLVALNFGRQSDPRLQSVWDHLNLCLLRLDSRLGHLHVSNETSPRLVSHGVELELGQLSDGYQSLLVMIFDLALRYPYLFELDNPLEGRAVVAIDEVDLHLHPRWQRGVVAHLTTMFPNTQFVLTTHSPVVVQGAIDSGRTVVVLQNQGHAVIPRVLGRLLRERLNGAEIGSLLLEHRLFGVESRYSVAFSQIEARVNELQQRIHADRASDDDYDELTAALTQLEELVAKEDERRADSSTVAQMARLQTAFVQDLILELKRSRNR